MEVEVEVTWCSRRQKYVQYSTVRHRCGGRWWNVPRAQVVGQIRRVDRRTACWRLASSLLKVWRGCGERGRVGTLDAAGEGLTGGCGRDEGGRCGMTLMREA